MNLHPIIVHFPVALLTIYCVLEIVTTLTQTNNTNLRTMKVRSLWLGTLIIIPSLMTGEQAEHIVGRSSIVHMHEERAEMARNIFVFISVIYLASSTEFLHKIGIQKLGARTGRISICAQTLKNRHITALLAVVGFAVLGGVGALGGAITRGTEHDPIANFIISTFGNTTSRGNPMMTGSEALSQ